MNASIAIQILPFMDSDAETVRVVDAVIQRIQESGLNYSVGPFETTVEGDMEELMDLAKEALAIAAREGAPSSALYLKCFYKPQGHLLTIDEKISKHHR